MGSSGLTAHLQNQMKNRARGGLTKSKEWIQWVWKQLMFLKFKKWECPIESFFPPTKLVTTPHHTARTHAHKWLKLIDIGSVFMHMKRASKHTNIHMNIEHAHTLAQKFFYLMIMTFSSWEVWKQQLNEWTEAVSQCTAEQTWKICHMNCSVVSEIKLNWSLSFGLQQTRQ